MTRGGSVLPDDANMNGAGNGELGKPQGGNVDDTDVFHVSIVREELGQAGPASAGGAEPDGAESLEEMLASRPSLDAVEVADITKQIATELSLVYRLVGNAGVQTARNSSFQKEKPE